MTFLYSYLAATIAQGVLSRLRVRLVCARPAAPHEPTSTGCRVGDLISRCTADVEALDTVFSSGIAVLVANLVRLLTLTVGMVVLSPAAHPRGRPGRAAAGDHAPVLAGARPPVRARDAHRDRGAHGAAPGESAGHRGHSRVRPGERKPSADSGGCSAVRWRRRIARPAISALYTPVTAILVRAGGRRAAVGRNATDVRRVRHLARHAWRRSSFSFSASSSRSPRSAKNGKPSRAPWPAPSASSRRWPRRSESAPPVASEAGEPTANGRRSFSIDVVVRICRGPAGAARDHPGVRRGRARGAGRTNRRREDQRSAAPRGALRSVGRHGADRGPRSGVARGIGATTSSSAWCLRVVQLFSGTIFENLTLGDVVGLRRGRASKRPGSPGSTRSFGPSRWAIDRCSASSSGGKGTQLSAGQQQLLALARALVHKPAVLLLDEATAAIDNVSDAAFRAALRQSVLPAGCAVLTVAHRLSTAIEADRVVVLERGLDRRGRRSGRARAPRPVDSPHCSSWKPPAGIGGRVR